MQALKGGSPLEPSAQKRRATALSNAHGLCSRLRSAQQATRPTKSPCVRVRDGFQRLHLSCNGSPYASPYGKRSLSSSHQRGRLQTSRALRTSASSEMGDLLSGLTLNPEDFATVEEKMMLKAIELAQRDLGMTQPHPNAGCVLTNPENVIVGEGALYANGTQSAEVHACEEAAGSAAGGIAYLNLEPGDCHGENAGVRALLRSGVKQVVIGLLHPMPHFRGHAVRELRTNGIEVKIFGEDIDSVAILSACQLVNEPLRFRAATGRPFSILKFAMTLDGKIAATTGHAAWVTSAEARAYVFRQRAYSDAVIVGGCTVRRDNPRLTTRMDNGHAPARIVLTRSMDLPLEANLWDTSTAPTFVMTQRGAQVDKQEILRSKGVEVVEFDFLTPGAVMDYCAQRGFLQCFWECGGNLSAPAILDGVIHKVMGFVAPKIVGGVTAPTPVGDLGNVQMTQAIELDRPHYETIGRDLMVTGYITSSYSSIKPVPGSVIGHHLSSKLEHDAHGESEPDGALELTSSEVQQALVAAWGLLPGPPQGMSRRPKVIRFFKAWDEYGCFSNFSPHPIVVDSGIYASDTVWSSSEHFYQAQKFFGVEDARATELIEQIRCAASPEEAAKLGRTAEKMSPELVVPEWTTKKLEVMRMAVQAKFSQHSGPRKLLLSTAASEGTAASVLIEASPHDRFWGIGFDGMGENALGKILMELRGFLVAEESLAKEGQLTG
mmetsp:Transcript_2218/g.7942  ORF Transcript_2218/g.7942 Transcript_2218/m.7942 type:complete len:720 (+) Transcript_2218:195-2354(+)